LATKVAEPKYKATCRLFVAIGVNTTPGETFQGSSLAQDRVVAYLELIKGDRVAQRAINRLGLDISAPDLVNRIEATAAAKSVLMDVSVTDSQSQRSADLANAVCEEFQGVAVDTEAPNSAVNVKLVETASAPQNPISPSAKRNLAVGALVGLLVGLGLVRALDRIWPVGEPDPKPVQPEQNNVAIPPPAIPGVAISRIDSADHPHPGEAVRPASSDQAGDGTNGDGVDGVPRHAELGGDG
jgi:capsular polysaccharide biosynthesis protein